MGFFYHNIAKATLGINKMSVNLRAFLNFAGVTTNIKNSPPAIYQNGKTTDFTLFFLWPQP